MSSLGPLPVHVRHYRGETTESYWGRLCRANALTQTDLWLAMRHIYPDLPVGVTPRKAIDQIEVLGGMQGRLRNGVNGLGCGHREATQRVDCPRCRMLPVPVTLCRRCTGGELVTAARPSGPICLRHARWHADKNDLDMSGHPKHEAAQRILNGPLLLRGVSYRSSEVEAATELLCLRRNGSNPDGEEQRQDLQMELLPASVQAVYFLTDDRVAQVLMQPRIGSHALALVIDQIVTAAVRGRRAVHQVRNGLKVEGRELWVNGVSLPLQGGCALTPFGQMILPRASTVRARLLRHRSELLPG